MLRLDELNFSEERHIYKLNGVEIPSVSRIIEPISGSVYGSVDPVVLSRAADRGTAVHRAIELYNGIGVMDIDPELSGYTDAYEEWYELRRPVVRASEIRVYHKIMRYAGTADCIAEIDGKVWLIDYKTSYKTVDKTYRLQLEAYRQALATHGVEIDGKMVLHLSNGKYEEIVYQTQDAEAWKVFGACKAIYDYLATNRY